MISQPATIYTPACTHPSPPTCGGADRSNPTNASTSMQGGAAVFDNKNYRITAQDDGSVLINNKNTGEQYKVWGDPHVNVDGKEDFDFYGKTTFVLEDNTKITIDTIPFKDHPGTTMASQVTITNGDYGVRISGVDSQTKGDLKIDEAAGYGRELDAVTSDGNVLQENPAGKGFLAVDGQGQIKKVDQDYINKTDLVKTGKLEDKYKEALEKFKSLVSIAFDGVFVGGPKEGCSPKPGLGDQYPQRPGVGEHSHPGHHCHPHPPSFPFERMLRMTTSQAPNAAQSQPAPSVDDKKSDIPQWTPRPPIVSPLGEKILKEHDRFVNKLVKNFPFA